MRPFQVMRLRNNAVGGNGFLDGLSVTPRAALSLRKMISTATVSIRVRRSSDNAEQDIGFSGNSLDTTALSSFVGAGSGFVTTMYDQTGNAEHAVQATASKQPRIVNAGVYDGKLIFDGTDDGMAISVLTLGNAFAGLYTKIGLPGTYSGNPMIYELSPDFATNGPGTVASFWAPEGGSNWSVQSNCNNVRRHTYSPSWATLTLATVLYDTTQPTGSSELILYISGASQTPFVGSNLGQTGNYRSDKDFFIGSRNNASLFCRLDVETFVIYNADTAAIRSSIESIVA